jgi:hypothetical protein
MVDLAVALSVCGGRSSPFATAFKFAAATAAIRPSTYHGFFQPHARLCCAVFRKLAEKPEESRRKGLEKTYELALLQGPKRQFSTPRGDGLGSQHPKVPGFSSVETVRLRPAIRKSSAIFRRS